MIVVAMDSIGEPELPCTTSEGASVGHVWIRKKMKRHALVFILIKVTNLPTYATARRATFVRYTCSHFSRERAVWHDMSTGHTAEPRICQRTKGGVLVHFASTLGL